MESKHKKSKRSLNGEDVYEFACRYDVGWSKKKEKRNDGSLDSGMDDTQSVDINKVSIGVSRPLSRALSGRRVSIHIFLFWPTSFFSKIIRVDSTEIS